MRERGPWKIKSSKTVYSDPWIAVQRDEVIRPDGKDGSYATVNLKSGVCVIAIDENNTVHLTEEFHYAVGRDTIEGVSGGIEDGESPELAARRELAEELGLQAEKWTRLGQVDPFTAAIYSTVELYVAEELTQGETNLEGTELIRCRKIPFSDAIEMVRGSVISHAPTCVALLRLALDRETDL